ncbi:hypothetical protein PRZ48_002741 [Zasmidium cellare]|uniref:Uncharacterized protein n=1 Tax=Zasmidium cellare TaxID=395010 RepID=A0ABR0ETP6_ZASCE|nr:hypothetical protein PRZ48_002741 [Zasmidium cellare]
MRADVPPNDPKLPSEATTALIEFFHKSQSANAHLSSDWLYSLPTTMKSRGCEVLTQQWTPAKKQLQRAWCDNYLTVWQGVMAKLPEEEFPIPPIQGLQEKMTRGLFFKVLQKAAAECAQGVFINCELCTFVCRKAA